MASGEGHGFHARYFSTQWLGSEMRHVRAENEAFGYRPFWDELTAAGKRVTIFDVPYLPSRRSEAARTRVGWGMHDEVEDIAESEFWKAIERRHGTSPLTFDLLEPQSPSDRVNLAANLIKSATRRTAILEELVGLDDWDLLLMNYSEPHKALHYFSAPDGELADGMSYQEVFIHLLRTLDASWPRITTAVGEDCHIMLFSLHGTHHSADLSTFAPGLVKAARGEGPSERERTDLIRRIRNMLPRTVHEWLWRLLPAGGAYL